MFDVIGDLIYVYIVVIKRISFPTNQNETSKCAKLYSQYQKNLDIKQIKLDITNFTF
jgi:hypothetical protein